MGQVPEDIPGGREGQCDRSKVVGDLLTVCQSVRNVHSVSSYFCSFKAISDDFCTEKVRICIKSTVTSNGPESKQ